jgi:hypothetical protein
LFHDIIQVFDLADRNRGAMLLVGAFDGRCIGLTAVNRDRCGDTMPTDRLLEKPSRRRFVTMFGEQKVHGLAVFVDSAIEIAPLPLHFTIRLIHAPTGPDGTLAPVKGVLELGAILDHPPVHGGVIHLHPPFLHACFDMARA